MKFLLNEYDVPQAIQNLATGLNGNLTLGDNFDTFEWEGAIATVTEVMIPNQFRDGRPPTFFIAMPLDGPNAISKGPTAWTSQKLYLKNWHTGTVTVRVIFFR